MIEMFDIIRYTAKIPVLLAAIFLTTGCVEETLAGQEDGRPVTATLTFSLPDIAETVVTKTNSYSRLGSLLLFIFNEDGSRCEQIVETQDGSLTLAGGSAVNIYTATFSTTTGTKRICALGNYVTDNNWQYFDMSGAGSGDISQDDSRWGDFSKYVESLRTGAETGMSSSQLGSSLFFLSKTFSDNGNTPTFDEQQMIMTGADKISIDGNGNPSGTLYLERCVADIQFVITSENDITTGDSISFIPTNYYIYNIPAGTRLAPNRGIEENPNESYREFYFDGSRKTILPAEGGEYSFQFFIPENIQENVDTCSSYVSRENWDSQKTDEAKPDHKWWKHERLNATYVVINGQYTELDKDNNLKYSGETSYTVHLGDFSGGDTPKTGKDYNGWGNFTIERNHRYIYRVTVKGIENIRVEAEDKTELQPGAEGSIVSTTETTRNYSLDAHFEQVLLEYNLSSIATAAANTKKGTSMTDAEAISEHLIVTIETPFQAIAELRPYLSASLGNDKTDVLAGIDYKWVEFWPQSTCTLAAYPGLPSWKSTDGQDSRYESRYLLDVYDACVKMGEVVRKIMNNETVNTGDYREDGITVVTDSNGDYWARFTGFVDEYYYTSNPVDAGMALSWGDFTNQSQRRMLISMDVETSPDNNSSFSTVHTNISQRSMQTFYNVDNTELNAFGMETFNETPLSRYGNPPIYGYSDTDGRSNQSAMLKDNYGRFREWDYFIKTESNGYTNNITGKRKLENAYCEGNNNVVYAYYSCMTRNRDLDGNGYISDDEVHWYLPALNEYLRIGMGTIAMSNESNLYIGDKSAMRRGQDNNYDGWPDDDDWYPENYYKEGALYHTSTYGKETFWAVEKGAYGGRTSGDIPIRCIRHLPAELEDYATPADPMYDLYRLSNNSYMLDFRDKFDNNMYRPTRTGEQLNEHDEDDLQNRFYDGLVISSSPQSAAAKLDAILNIGNNKTNPCASYYEGDYNDPVSGAGHWRVPNLAELTIMSTNARRLLSGSTGYLYSSTKFSNDKVRVAFRYGDTQISCLGNNGEKTSDNIWVNYRCVRDAAQRDFDEINGQQPIN